MTLTFDHEFSITAKDTMKGLFTSEKNDGERIVI